MSVLTKADASNWHITESTHYNGGKEFFAYLHRCVEQPRLSRFDKYLRKSQSVESTWRTDGIDHPSMEAAIEALNTPPTFDAEELAFIATCPTEFTKKGPPGSINWEVNQRCVDKGAVEWQRGEYRITPAGRSALGEQPEVGGMRTKAETEIETAASILRAMGNTIEQMERWWPASKRGSNASRELEHIKAQRTTALQCLLDAQESQP